MLIGKTVRLRPERRSDKEYFLKWSNDPEVIHFDVEYLPLTEMEQEKWWTQPSATDGSNAHFIMEAIDVAPPKPIGHLGLHVINHKNRCASAGIVIGEKAYWGKGYGTEAVRLLLRYGFEELNLHRIYAEVWSFNERSLRTCLKLGFREEGRRREAVFKNGVYYDEVVFGLLKKEWLKLSR